MTLILLVLLFLLVLGGGGYAYRGPWVGGPFGFGYGVVGVILLLFLLSLVFGR